MPFANFGELKSAVADWLNRTNLTARIPSFVALCEADIKLDVRDQTTRTTLTVNAEETPLPAGVILRSIYPESGSPSRDFPLQIGTPEQVAEVRARHAGVNGRPVVAAVVDGTLVVAPVPDQSYTYRVTYFEPVTPLVDDADTNRVLQDAPNIYLYGTLRQAAPFLHDDERVALWQGFYDEAVAKLNKRREEAETSASIKKARLPVVFG